jgi:hypothetical protein
MAYMSLLPRGYKHNITADDDGDGGGGGSEIVNRRNSGD